MNVLSCGGVYRRISLALSACALIYLFIFHEDVPTEFYFGEARSHDTEHAAPRERSLESESQSKGKKSTLPMKCTDPESDSSRVVFLKTHKTASSTIQNILMRYGTKHKKTFALPATGKTIFKYWKSWSESDFHQLKDGPPDYLVHHMRFSPAVEKVFPVENSKYFSILRNPVIMFESLFNYMKTVAPQFSKAGTLEKFLSNPTKYQSIGKSKAMTSFFSRNHMTFEFGFNPNEEDDSTIAEMISRIETRFDFILINEFMPESLIVLRRYLCMELNDIACFITNARKSSSKLNSKMESQLRKWNHADWALYRHFNLTLWDKLDEIGQEQVKTEKEELESLVEKLTTECVDGYYENKDLPREFQVYKQPGVKVLGIKLTPEGEKNELCYSMARPEFPWTELIMKDQGQDVKTLKAFSKT